MITKKIQKIAKSLNYLVLDGQEGYCNEVHYAGDTLVSVKTEREDIFFKEYLLKNEDYKIWISLQSSYDKEDVKEAIENAIYDQ